MHTPLRGPNNLFIRNQITNIRKPICDIVFCVSAFLYVEFSVLCTMLHISNGAIHEVEPRWRTNEERRTRV